MAEHLKRRRSRAAVAKVSMAPFWFGLAGAGLFEDFKHEYCIRLRGLLTKYLKLSSLKTAIHHLTLPAAEVRDPGVDRASEGCGGRGG